MIRVKIQAHPKPQTRPRFRTFTSPKTGKNVTQPYELAEMRDYKKMVAEQMDTQYGGDPIAEPLLVVFEFWETPTKTDASKGCEAKIHTKKRDLDNFVKAVLDAGSEVIWEDDRYIFATFAVKCIESHDKEGRTEVRVYKLSEVNDFCMDVAEVVTFVDVIATGGSLF